MKNKGFSGYYHHSSSPNFPSDTRVTHWEKMMATIRKRGAKWQATIRRKNCPTLVKSFLLKGDVVWARQQ